MAGQAPGPVRLRDRLRGSVTFGLAESSEVFGNLMKRFWLESQGMTNINLESVGSTP